MNRKMILPILILSLLVFPAGAHASRGSVHQQIAGGVDVPTGTYPFAVRLEEGRRHTPFCSGSVISKRYVLTAAHCASAAMLFGSGTNEGIGLLDPIKLRWRVRFANLPGRPAVNVVRAAWWGSFDVLSLGAHDQSDLAVLQLATDAPTGPVELAGAPAAGAQVRELGYGPRLVDEKDGMHLNLGQGDMQVAEGSVCSVGGPGGPDRVYVNREICTTGSQLLTAGACHGDSGGPLLNELGQQVGVTSWGPRENCNTSAAGRRTVFARVDAGLGWLMRQTGVSLAGREAVARNISYPRGIQVRMALHGRWLHVRVVAKDSQGEAPRVYGFVGASVYDKRGRTLIEKGYDLNRSFQRIHLPSSLFHRRGAVKMEILALTQVYNRFMNGAGYHAGGLNYRFKRR